jgi:hypothetical protein
MPSSGPQAVTLRTCSPSSCLPSTCSPSRGFPPSRRMLSPLPLFAATTTSTCHVTSCHVFLPNVVAFTFFAASTTSICHFMLRLVMFFCQMLSLLVFSLCQQRHRVISCYILSCFSAEYCQQRQYVMPCLPAKCCLFFSCINNVNMSFHVTSCHVFSAECCRCCLFGCINNVNMSCHVLQPNVIACRFFFCVDGVKILFKIL